jgi:3-hydroxyisobutyrate dehydrogenase-like beta-hydroxyacid dehydrogenase
VFSLVTADQAFLAAEHAAQHLQPDSWFFDMNSVAPARKRAAAKSVSASGARYVDVAVMAPVIPASLSVPLLVSGNMPTTQL